MEKLQSLKLTDAENVQKAILSLILQYPYYPDTFEPNNKTVKWSNIDTDNSIGLFPLSGAVYLEKYVDGTYLGQMPFQLVYRSSPTTNKSSIEAQNVVECIGKWLEGCDISFESVDICFEEIERTSTVYPVKIDEKTTGYGININVKYTAEL